MSSRLCPWRHRRIPCLWPPLRFRPGARPCRWFPRAAINMVYGGAATGKAVMTSSSSPGVSLKQEGISYIAASELPALIVNVMRGGPGLGTIQPSQADYFQAVVAHLVLFNELVCGLEAVVVLFHPGGVQLQGSDHIAVLAVAFAACSPGTLSAQLFLGAARTLRRRWPAYVLRLSRRRARPESKWACCAQSPYGLSQRHRLRLCRMQPRDIERAALPRCGADAAEAARPSPSSAPRRRRPESLPDYGI